MIKEEYKRLLGMLENSLRPGGPSLEEILKEAVVFFETLRAEFPTAEKEEREEMIQMMSDLHSRLQQISKATAKASGMSEEELAAFAENPSNFSPDQWQIVQATKRKLYDSARKFSSSMNKEKREGQAPEGEAPKTKPIRKRTRRTKRSDWTKS